MDAGWWLRTEEVCCSFELFRACCVQIVYGWSNATKQGAAKAALAIDHTRSLEQKMLRVWWFFCRYWRIIIVERTSTMTDGFCFTFHYVDSPGFLIYCLLYVSRLKPQCRLLAKYTDSLTLILEGHSMPAREGPIIPCCQVCIILKGIIVHPFQKNRILSVRGLYTGQTGGLKLRRFNVVC